ncbi:fungal-specific transcription factor domain-containing protein [Halenospora varia]|nr:fungal-specific transcription factor domain-containing protein [Halenospora varia]
MSHSGSTKEQVTGSSSSGGADEEHAACQSCRRRKLKCSRENPACSQCSRLDTPCIYDAIRQKPGMKGGAIEALNRRLLVLEDMLLQQDGTQKPPPPSLAQHEAQHSMYHMSLMLAKELQRIGAHPCSGQDLSPLQADETRQTSPSRKRKRGGCETNASTILNVPEEDNISSSLPPKHVLDVIIPKYFQTLHHWIPFLHEAHFNNRLASHDERQQLVVVLHAIVAAALRLVSFSDVGMSLQDVELQINRSRQAVLLTAMDCPTIENLQALTIIAFDHIGGGRVSKAWSLIGSLTRTVEYLRLTVEPEEMLCHPLRKPLSLLANTNDWTEVEERRRLFWNIFLLDRFCSITTGWSTSLTSDDVHRKLPCDGGLWAREEPSETPFFGIWNKSAARIGNSITFIPAHYPTPDHELDQESVRSPGTMSGSTVVDTSKLGAFAYCIEATESLSQVTTFFLQQKVDFKNRQEVGSWLTRFKELDLRLVHWKMFLPPKWKDSNISRDTSFVDMDPNLTLAHITHNTSMILLHQHIAYPPPDWRELVKLPSSCSAETCQMAAVETSSISQKYLKYNKTGIANSQFALCAFIAGRILLVHWRFYNTGLASEFFTLVESLREMSTRWRGYATRGTLEQHTPSLDLAGQYAIQLEYFHELFYKDSQQCMNVLGYSATPATANQDSLLPLLSMSPPPHKVDDPPSSAPHQANPSIFQSQSPQGKLAESLSCSGVGNLLHASGPREKPKISSNLGNGEGLVCNTWIPHTWHDEQSSGGISKVPDYGTRLQKPMDYDRESVDDDLTAMSSALLGQQFLEMDRVITFDGTNFSMDINGWQNIG